MTSEVKLLLGRLDGIIDHSLSMEIRDRAKQSLLDYIGVSIAGAHASEKMSKLCAACREEHGGFFAIGGGCGVSLKDAVFLNGLFAHAFDLDDGANAGIVHLGSPIFSLLIPLAAKYESSGDRLIESAILGYEVAWTLAYSIQPGHKLLGYHATGTCGMLGAIIAGSHLLGFSRDERFRAFSTGCVSAGGTLKVLEDASELKPYNVAKASLLALVSLQMAKAGFEVPVDAMSGDRGFLKMMAGSEIIKIKPFLLDGRCAITRTYTKPYAACRYCHPAIEAAISLARDEGVSALDVERIEVRTYELAVRGHDHTDIQGISSAKMSIPYGVAVGYLRGRAGLSEYAEDAVRDPEVLSLCSKVSVEMDIDFSAAFPEKTVAVVRVIAHDGRVLERRVDHPLGEPENPLGLKGVRRKFREMASFAGMPLEWQEDVMEAVGDVEKSLPRLLSLLSEGVGK